MTAVGAARAWSSRWRAMGGIALGMMLHDKAKLAAGFFGVVFATVLSTQQAGTFYGLMNRNTMVMRHIGADVWITPPGVEMLQPSKALRERLIYQARAVEGVAWAEPLLLATAVITRPDGGTEPITLLGVTTSPLHTGPWNVVAGDPRDLAQPDAIFVEDTYRERFGGVNLGSVREINGHRVHIVGFHWGLLPFAPPYAFVSYDKAREIVGQRDRTASFIMIGLAPSADAAAVAARLGARFGDQAQVLTSDQFARRAIHFILTRSPIGVSLGTSTLFGLLVGFIIVAIAMFSSVVDHLREFGTLKAIGAGMRDLKRVMLVQSLVYGAFGSGIGLGLVGFLVRAIHSPNLALALPGWVVAIMPPFMVLICIGASSLALMRLRRLEPGIVFRQ